MTKLHFHKQYWNPDPYRPLDTPRWEEQMTSRVRGRARELLQLYKSGLLDFEDFIQDRKTEYDNDWGMRMCLWHQHHRHKQTHKNLGRPFWSVDAFRQWVANIESLPEEQVLDKKGFYDLRTLQRERNGKPRAFLRHEHVVPKSVMINWLVEEPDNVDVIFDNNVCCVLSLDEDTALNRVAKNTHPDPTDPWLRYEGTGIEILFNPDWPDDVLQELKHHGLMTKASFEPFDDRTSAYRLADFV